MRIDLPVVGDKQVNLAPAVTHQRPRKRRKLKRATEGLFPGEVVRTLGLRGVDYRQLRDMLRLARESRGEAFKERRWATYSFRDLCAIRIIVELFGGPSAIAAGAHLRLRALREVCVRLRTFGFTDPLLQVKLTRVGSEIVAQSEGVRFEAATGQILIDDLFDQIGPTLQNKSSAVAVSFDKERRKMARATRTSLTSLHSSIAVEGTRG